MIPLSLALTISLGGVAEAVEPVWPKQADVASSQIGQEDAVLIVAIGDYLYVNDRPDVSGAAEGWQRWFSTGRGVASENMIVLKDGEATRKAIDKAWNKLAKRVGDKGDLYLVFMGHGSSHKGRPLLIPADTPANANGPRKNGVYWSDILKGFKKGKQANGVAIIDACFNGKTQSGTPLNVPAKPPVATDFVDDKVNLTVLMSNGMSECGGMLPQLSQSPFSYLTLGAARGWADADKNGATSLKEAVAYVNLAASKGNPERKTTARILGSNLDLTFSKGAEVGPDLEMINLRLYPKRKEKRGPNFLPWDVVQGAADFDDLLVTLKERRDMAITFQAESSERTNALLEKAQRHWSDIESFSEQAVDDYSRMAAYAYVNKYKDAAISVQNHSMAVDVPQLQEAEKLILGMEIPELAEKGDYQFAWIPNGSFIMGSPVSEADRDVVERQHPVRLTHSFYVSKTEVTQELYQTITGSNPSSVEGPALPVNRVTWLDAIRFSNRLSLKEGLEPCYAISGEQVSWPKGAKCEGYRLPTEAEWEYVARANSPGIYAGGDDLSDIAWFEGNSSGQVQPVAGKEANGWGVFDMSGNVWEWVWDGFGEYPKEEAIDPTGAVNSSYRIRRGGSVGHLARYARNAYRVRIDPKFRSYDIGFRIVRTALMPEE